MGVKRIVDTSFWTDDKVIESFSPEDKLFMIYVITNPHTTQLGIYHINKKNMAFEVGYSLDTVSVLLDRFENKYQIIRYSNETNEIAIKNYLKHSIMKGGKPVEDLLKKEINRVKDKTLLKYIFNNIKDYDNLNVTVNNIIDLLNINDINDNKNENENEDSYHESHNESLDNFSKLIIDYLNSRVGTRYSPYTKSTIKCIKERINESKKLVKAGKRQSEYKFDDFVQVIDNKVQDWKNTSYEMYLRPSTLFGSKFDEYLNQKDSSKPIWFDKKQVAFEMTSEEKNKMDAIMEKYK